MWRIALVGIGTLLALLGTGIARDILHIDYSGLFFVLGFACWLVAVIGWKIHAALLATGVALFIAGAIMFFVMPQVVNAGSGQDAVTLFATIGGGATAVVGLLLVAVGAIFLKIPTR